MLKRQTRLCAVPVETVFILEVSLVEHLFRPAFPQMFLLLVLVLSGVLPLVRNTFRYMQIVGLVIGAHREIFTGIYGDTCRNYCIYRMYRTKRAMFQCNPQAISDDSLRSLSVCDKQHGDVPEIGLGV